MLLDREGPSVTMKTHIKDTPQLLQEGICLQILEARNRRKALVMMQVRTRKGGLVLLEDPISKVKAVTSRKGPT